MSKPKWQAGQRFKHRDTGQAFEVAEVVTLAPAGRIGYQLRAVGADEIPEFRRFETELSSGREFVVEGESA